MNDLIKGVVAYKTIDHFYTSADARLHNKAIERQLEFQKQTDQQRRDYEQKMHSDAIRNASLDRIFQEDQREKDRLFTEIESSRNRSFQLEMQAAEHTMRQKELEVEQDKIATQRFEAELNAKTTFINAERDRDVRMRMHAETLSQQEQLELRKLRVQENISRQSAELKKYLYDKGIKEAKELERFKALATRETQILIARENAQNALNDQLVQQALNNFPLNISPIVLLRNKHDSLIGLMRFSHYVSDNTILPPIATVYEDIREYCDNPEAITIFIAPIYIAQNIEGRESVSEKIWDAIYHKLESFLIKYYSRNGKNPAIVYPTAWKDGVSSGQHASETLHFFLKDIPCVVLEPRFDGHTLKVMMSSWGVGYLSTNHSREEMEFPINLDFLMIESAYERSIKSLALLDTVKELSTDLEDRRIGFEHNIKYYELLNIAERAKDGDFEEIEALGSYQLFNIDLNLDTKKVSDIIASIICLNLAIIVDAHHLVATDATPVLPSLFKKIFPDLFNNLDIRQLTCKCYEKVYLYLRHQEALATGVESKREIERVREVQITNLKKQLELLTQTEISVSMNDKLKKYVLERFKITSENLLELWNIALEQMTIEDISFFKELLPNIEDRRLYKKVDKKLSELQR